MNNKQTYVIIFLSIVLTFFIWDRFSSPMWLLRSEVKELKTQIKKIDEEKKNLEDQRALLQTQFQSLEAKSKSQQQRLDQLKGMTTASEEDIKKAQEIINRDKKEAQSVQDEINQLIKNPKILQGDTLINSLREKLNF